MPAATKPGRRPARGRPAPAEVLMLDDVLDLRAAAPFKAALMARRGADLRVDASGVLHLGAQCAQLLLAAAAAWAEDGLTFTVQAASEPFEQGTRLLGIHPTLFPQGSLP